MNDREALAFAAAVLPELSEAERQFVLTVSRFETNYGTGWVGLARKLGAEDPEAFAHVNNWGAITAPSPGPNQGPAFFIRDRWWRIYDSPEAGLKGAASTILKPNVKAKLKKGDGSGAVQSMGDNGYFIEPEKAKQFGGSKAEQIKRYRMNVERNYDDFIRETGVPAALRFTGGGGLGIGDFLVAGAFVGGIIGAVMLLGGGGSEEPK